MSWSFRFRGVREKVTAAVKDFKPYSPMPDAEREDVEKARSIVLFGIEANPQAPIVEVFATGHMIVDSEGKATSRAISFGVKTEHDILL